MTETVLSRYFRQNSSIASNDNQENYEHQHIEFASRKLIKKIAETDIEQITDYTAFNTEKIAGIFKKRRKKISEPEFKKSKRTSAHFSFIQKIYEDQNVIPLCINSKIHTENDVKCAPELELLHKDNSYLTHQNGCAFDEKKIDTYSKKDEYNLRKKEYGTDYETSLLEISDKFISHSKMINQLKLYMNDEDISKVFFDYEAEYFKRFVKIQTEVGQEMKTDLAVRFWIPPKSPHNLIEEVLYHDSWALLIATIFLNKTSCMVARPYIFWFLFENPDPMSVMNVFPKDLEKYFYTLGLMQTRAVQIWRMTHDYLHKDWIRPTELYGIGNYGDCAYKMFCLGDFNIEPRDRFLRIYKGWYEKIFKKSNNYNT